MGLGTGGAEGMGWEGTSREEAVQNAACVSPWIRSEAGVVEPTQVLPELES